MNVELQKLKIDMSEQGFLTNLNDWSEEFATSLADSDHIPLHVDHWELIYYFREYYKENQTHPSMHQLVMSLGKHQGQRFHNHKAYEKHIYSLFPTDPLNEICKLAGLPMPPPDT